MSRSRGVAVGLATVLAVAGGVATGAGAAAAQAQVAVSGESREGVLERDADGTLLVRLGGSGPGESVVVDGSVLGEVMVVPGDAGGASLRVRNEGPSAGVLTASIVNAVAFRDPGNQAWVDDSFYDDLTVNGVAASQLESKQTVVRQVRLDRGASTEVALRYAFPFEMTSGNSAFVGKRVFAFDILLRIGGDTADSDTEDQDLSRDRRPGSGDQVGTAGAPAKPGMVTHTGGAAMPDRTPWLLLLAAALTVVAARAARTLRRRSGEDHVETLE